MEKKSAYDYFGALKVKGNQLVNRENEVVMLRGVSTHGLNWYPEYVNEESILYMKNNWNIDILRLAMYTAETDGYCVGTEANKDKLKKVIDDGVKAATKAGLYVIIDWHILSDSNPLEHLEESLLFFSEMAELYHSYDNVIYEICNEPNVSATWEDIREYALKVIPVIREKAKDALILVGTPTWSQDVDLAWSNPIKEFDNLMYVLHFYADTHREELRNKMEESIKAGCPVFVSEFGICDASGNGDINIEQANLWIDLLEKYQVSYIIWNLSNRDESSAFFKENCKKLIDFQKEDLQDAANWFLDSIAKRVQK